MQQAVKPLGDPLEDEWCLVRVFRNDTHKHQCINYSYIPALKQRENKTNKYFWVFEIFAYVFVVLDFSDLFGIFQDFSDFFLIF